jgi:antibiotic biosynthesis monooxygenase (ABM) superfamily enzyme
MSSSPPDSHDAKLEIRGARASSVIIQRVQPGAAELFLEWQRGITAAAAVFPGYQTTEIYPPNAQQEEWVVILHFDDPQTLQSWLDSPTRADWVARRPFEIRDYRLKTLPSGFGAWFSGQIDASGGALPPSWKIALSVLLPLYPTVMLLTIVAGPYLSPLGLAMSMLISNALSVAILQWAVTPVLNPLLAPWLRANGEGQRSFSLTGLFVILLLLAGMAILFRLATG